MRVYGDRQRVVCNFDVRLLCACVMCRWCKSTLALLRVSGHVSHKQVCEVKNQRILPLHWYLRDPLDEGLEAVVFHFSDGNDFLFFLFKEKYKKYYLTVWFQWFDLIWTETTTWEEATKVMHCKMRCLMEGHHCESHFYYSVDLYPLSAHILFMLRLYTIMANDGKHAWKCARCRVVEEQYR